MHLSTVCDEEVMRFIFVDATRRHSMHVWTLVNNNRNLIDAHSVAPELSVLTANVENRDCPGPLISPDDIHSYILQYPSGDPGRLGEYTSAWETKVACQGTVVPVISTVF